MILHIIVYIWVSYIVAFLITEQWPEDEINKYILWFAPITVLVYLLAYGWAWMMWLLYRRYEYS